MISFLVARILKTFKRRIHLGPINFWFASSAICQNFAEICHLCQICVIDMNEEKIDSFDRSVAYRTFGSVKILFENTTKITQVTLRKCWKCCFDRISCFEIFKVICKVERKQRPLVACSTWAFKIWPCVHAKTGRFPSNWNKCF